MHDLSDHSMGRNAEKSQGNVRISQCLDNGHTVFILSTGEGLKNGSLLKNTKKNCYSHNYVEAHV